MKKIIFIASILIAFIACQKVVNVDLKKVDSKYVIEGVITDSAGPYAVHITQTKDFQESNTFPGVSGALVIITDVENHTIDTLAEIKAGVYHTKKITGTLGHTYKLWVNAGASTFTSTSQMPLYKASIDSLKVLDMSVFGKILKVIVPVSYDPPGVRNYYHLEQYQNGRLDKTVYVSNDDFTDGQWNVQPLIMNDIDSTFKNGDTALVDLQCIDVAVYKYWYTMQQATGSGDKPTNPITNISGGALGYFSAHTSSKKSVIVK